MVRSLIALSLAAAMVLVVSVAGASGEVSQSEIDELVSGLLQSNFQIIMKASDALAEIGEPCVPALRRALETANDKWGRINIISVLKRIPGEQSISALVYCLDDIDGYCPRKRSQGHYCSGLSGPGCRSTVACSFARGRVASETKGSA